MDGLNINFYGELEISFYISFLGENIKYIVKICICMWGFLGWLFKIVLNDWYSYINDIFGLGLDRSNICVKC